MLNIGKKPDCLGGKIEMSGKDEIREETVMYGSQDLGVTVYLRFLKKGAVIEVHTKDQRERMLLVIPSENADKLKVLSEALAKGIIGLPIICFQAFLLLLDLDVDMIEAKGDRVGEALGRFIDEIIEVAEGQLSKLDLIQMERQ